MRDVEKRDHLLYARTNHSIVYAARRLWPILRAGAAGHVRQIASEQEREVGGEQCNFEVEVAERNWILLTFGGALTATQRGK
jgi:hypothetical protein